MSEWADQFRKLSSESSAEPGQWRTDRAPYQKEILDCLNEHAVERITIKASAQVGKSEILLNAIGFFSQYDPAPIMLVQPTLEMAEGFSKDRIAPMIRDTPSLVEIFGAAKSRSGDSTLLYKKFPGGHLSLTGSNSPASLASRPIRILLMDEVDRFPRSSGDEGDPVSLATKRTTTFYNKKIVAVSTPTIQNRSRIDQLYRDSDQRAFQIPCPHCKEFIKLEFKQLKWSDNDPSTTVFICSSCDAIIEERLKHSLMLKGKWIAGMPFKGHAGFAVNELYSPWKKWAKIVEEFLEAKKNPMTLRTWVNTSMGEVFEEKGEAPEWEHLYARREEYEINSIPSKVLFLTAGCDVQKDRLEIEVKGWAKFKRSYSIDYRVIMGDTSQKEVWQKLSDILEETWIHPNGQVLKIKALAVDSGFNTQHVYSFVRDQQKDRVIATKGNPTLQTILATPKAVDVNKSGKAIRRGVKVWHIGVNILKSETYALLKLKRQTDEETASGAEEPHGFIHFPQYNEEYFKQLTSESLVSRTSKGFVKYDWLKNYERNEALDVHILNRAAASFVGMDRYKEAHWLKLEAQMGILDEGRVSKETSSVQLEQNEPKNVPVVKEKVKTKIVRRTSSFW